MDRMDQFLLGKPKYDLNHPAIKTGFESIDLQTSFLRRGTLALLGSRPGMGKTTIALQIASNITDAGGTVLVFSLRQSVSQVSDRVYTFKRDLTSCCNFYAEDRVGNIDEMKLVMKDFRKPVDLILVDCLQDVYYLSPKRHPVYSSPNACAALKVMARHHNAAVLALTQISRAVEGRADHHPLLTDIPGWESIKQSVDSACLFSRGGYYEIEDEDTELPATLSFCPSTDKCCSVFMKWNHQANCLKDST